MASHRKHARRDRKKREATGQEHTTAAIGRSRGRLAIIVNLLAIAPLALAAHLQTYSYRDNITLWQKTLAENPASWMVREHMGSNLQQAGRYAEALHQYQEAVNLNPKSASAHKNLGLLLARQSPANIEVAVTHLLTAVQLDPEDAGAHTNLGLARLQQGQVDEAVKEQETALALDPDNALIHCNYGIALEKADRDDQALSAFDDCLKLDPDNAVARWHLAEIEAERAGTLAMAGRYDEAIKAFREALEIAPDEAAPDLHNNLGLTLATAGRLTEAIGEFSTAIRLRPAFPAAQANLQRAQALLKTAKDS